MSYRGSYIQELRGNIGHPTFFSLVSANTTYHREYSGSGRCVGVTEAESGHFYTYAQTFVARMGLALGKYEISNDNGHPFIPLVPFDRHWTDEALAAEIGLTPEEMQAIYQALPDYHGLLS